MGKSVVGIQGHQGAVNCDCGNQRRRHCNRAAVIGEGVVGAAQVDGNRVHIPPVRSEQDVFNAAFGVYRNVAAEGGWDRAQKLGLQHGDIFDDQGGIDRTVASTQRVYIVDVVQVGQVCRQARADTDRIGIDRVCIGKLDVTAADW